MSKTKNDRARHGQNGRELESQTSARRRAVRWKHFCSASRGDGISPEDRWRLTEGCICKLDKRKSSGAVDCCGAVSDHKIEVDLMLFTDMIRVGNVI